MKYKSFIVGGEEFKSLSEASVHFGIPKNAVYKRMSNKGLSIEEALTRKLQRNSVTVDHLGHKFSSQEAMAQAWGITSNVFCMRYKKRGWSLERSLTTLPKGKEKMQQDNYKDLTEEVRRLRTQLEVLEKTTKSVIGADVRRTFYLIQKVQAAETAVSTACSYASFLVNEVHKF